MWNDPSFKIRPGIYTVSHFYRTNTIRNKMSGPPPGFGGQDGGGGGGGPPPGFGGGGSFQPYDYYETLRQRPGVSYEAYSDAAVTKVRDGNETIRLLQVESFLPLTFPGSGGFTVAGMPLRLPTFDGFVYWDVAAHLASIHFNQRDSSVLPYLEERLKGCNVRMTLQLRDTQFSPRTSAQQLYPLLLDRDNTLQEPIPGALMGSLDPEVSKTLGVLSGVAGIPFVSPIEAGAYFDDQHTNAPTFARTTPSNPAFARAAAEMMRYWGVSHVGLLYSLDGYGRSFLETLSETTQQYGITLVASGYRATEEEFYTGVRDGLTKMKDLHYIVGIAFGAPALEGIMEEAIKLGLTSKEHVWIFPQNGVLSNPTYSIPKSNPALADAITSLIPLDLYIPENHPNFANQMVSYKFNPLIQRAFVQAHAEPEIWDLYNWTTSIPIIGTPSFLTYDAMMAIGFAACDIQDKEFFTGQDLYEQIVQRTQFEGLSGRVGFDNVTGTRLFEGVQFGFTTNTIDSTRSNDADAYFFKTQVSWVLDPASTNETVRQHAPYVFRTGSTIPPPSLPPVSEGNENLLSTGVRGFGWALGGLALLMACGLGIWTYLLRNNKMIRLSQPLFLGMMCVGASLMAASVFFLGWQEPWPGLDFACMATPWLLVLGFSTAFSALFTKTWRINRLFQHAVELNRANVKATDVLGPFLLLTLTNVGLLTAWTLEAPLEWTRTDDLDDVDQFGRPRSSFGACSGEGSRPIWLTLVAFNFLMVVFANYQSYLGRNIPSDFNESYFVALSMASLLECFLIGGPILFLVAENPMSDFVVKSVLITFGCGSILLPIYFSKFKARTRNLDRLEWSSYINNRNRTPSNISGGSRPQQQQQQRRRSKSRSSDSMPSQNLEDLSGDFLNGSHNSSDDNGRHDTVARIRASIARREGRALVNLASLEDASGELKLRRQHSLAVFRTNTSNDSGHQRVRRSSSLQPPVLGGSTSLASTATREKDGMIA